MVCYYRDTQTKGKENNMKILTLSSACKPLIFGGVGVAAIFGVAATGINAIHSSEVAELPIVEEVENPVLELPMEEPQEEVKELAEVEEEIMVVPPHTEVSQAQTKQSTNIPKTNDNVAISKEDSHSSASYNGMSRIQYEDAVKYTCPSQREVNIFETYQPAMSRLISIGKYSAYASIGREVPNDGVYTVGGFPQAYLELTWDKYKQYPSQYTDEGYALVLVEDKTLKFYINWSSLTVSWGKEDRDKTSASVTSTADFLATSWTNYLRSLEHSYKSRCPNN